MGKVAERMGVKGSWGCKGPMLRKAVTLKTSLVFQA